MHVYTYIWVCILTDTEINEDMCICTGKCVYIFPNSVHQEGIEANDTTVAKSTPGVQNLVSKYHFK